MTIALPSTASTRRPTTTYLRANLRRTRSCSTAPQSHVRETAYAARRSRSSPPSRTRSVATGRGCGRSGRRGSNPRLAELERRVHLGRDDDPGLAHTPAKVAKSVFGPLLGAAADSGRASGASRRTWNVTAGVSRQQPRGQNTCPIGGTCGQIRSVFAPQWPR